MRLRPRSTHRHTRAHGFSLVELSIVVAIIGVVSVLGLEAAANFVNRTNGAVTKERLLVLDDAIVRFFKIYGRLPCPADRTLAPSSTSYGLENCALATIAAPSASNGIMFGALPFRALNIPMNLSVDGFGSKINYAVTKNLTIAGTGVGQFGFKQDYAYTACNSGTDTLTVASTPNIYTGALIYDAGSNDYCTVTGSTATTIVLDSTCGVDGEFDCGGSTGTATLIQAGAIEIRSGVLQQACGSSACQFVASPTMSAGGAAYVLFSNGMDRKGGRSLRGDTLALCVDPNSTTDGLKIDAQNCANTGTGPYDSAGLAPRVNAIVTAPIPLNVFYDARFNTGFLAKNYFDDYIVWRSKAQL